MTMLAAQSDLQCQTCAGQCIYNPAHQGLECTHCGLVRRLETPDDDKSWAERDLADGDDKPVTLEAHSHHCETCGGDVIFTGPVLSERCAYCNGPVVLHLREDAFETMALIPFRVPASEAQKLALKWVARRLAAPGNLSDTVAVGRVAGLYAPFWTFDSKEAIRYWASYKRGKHGISASTTGSVHMRFNDMLVPASPHVTPLIRDGILHDFDPRRLRPYVPGYLAGFAAERHHQTVSEGLIAADDDKNLLIRNRIKQHIDERGVHNIRYRTDTTGIRYRRILLPVWILHYNYGNEPMKLVVCGLQGRAFGERPFSNRKLAAYAALISAATMATGLLWGALGFL